MPSRVGGTYLLDLFQPTVTLSPVNAIKPCDTSSCSLELDYLTLSLCIMGSVVIFIYCLFSIIFILLIKISVFTDRKSVV